MKRWYRQFWVGLLITILTVVITMLFRVTEVGKNANADQIVAMHNLYYVPILLAAMFLGETGAVVMALIATVASLFIINSEVHTSLGWWVISIRGAFYLTLGYLVATLTGRIQANSRNWQSLVEISRAINGSLDYAETLNVITTQSVELTSAEACAIRLLSPAGQELFYARSYGLSEKYLTKGPLHFDENSYLGDIFRNKKLVVRDVRKAKDLQYADMIREEGIIYIMNVPLLVGDTVIGLLNLYRKKVVGFNNRDCRIASAFAEQAAIAIQNARLYESIQRNYLDTVRALTRAIEAKDAYTFGHSERVAEYATKMAHALKLGTKDQQTLEFGALLHDLGKIGMDEPMSPSNNAPLDRQIMEQMHTMIGKSILDPVEFLHPAIPIVMYHHENWDGSGYPEGIAGEEIPLLARIVSVANRLDHLMYHYSPFPVPADIAFGELQEESGTAFDPQLVAVLQEIINGEHGHLPVETSPPLDPESPLAGPAEE